MARTAVVRRASLTPAEAKLADELAHELAGGSFTELIRFFLRSFGMALKQRLDELRESGIDPDARLLITRVTPPDTDAQIRDFYAPSTWPEDGPRHQ